MIYNFVFEGGCLDGTDVLTDCAQPDQTPSPAARWINWTLGGAVGLTFPVLNPECLKPAEQGPSSEAGLNEAGDQVYRVVYRDQHAGTVIVRCRHVPEVELVPHGIQRIVFTFEGGIKDGATEICGLAGGKEHASGRESRQRYWLTESGAVGKRFGAGSDAALQMLREEGPAAARDVGATLHIYEVMSRTEDGEDLRVQCKFLRCA